jgi:hypothetical protein
MSFRKFRIQGWVGRSYIPGSTVMTIPCLMMGSVGYSDEESLISLTSSRRLLLLFGSLPWGWRRCLATSRKDRTSWHSSPIWWPTCHLKMMMLVCPSACMITSILITRGGD